MASVVGRRWREMGKRMTSAAICLMLLLGLLGCSGQSSSPSDGAFKGLSVQRTSLEEVSPPGVIQELGRSPSRHEPQVKIVGLKPGETIDQTTATVRFEVEDFPIFKDAELSMGPHLQVLLDDQPYATVYDANQPITFSDLAPGSHIVRVFASSPWNESVKASSAFDQLRFNVFAPTQANLPKPNLPFLTYVQPQGEYGAEPILLDYILSLPDSKGKGTESAAGSKTKVRITVNGASFTTEENPPFYLKGFKPGANWVKVELLSPNGMPMLNPLSESLQLVTLKLKGSDTLSKLIRGELTAQDAEQIMSPEASQRRAAQRLEALSAPKVSPSPQAIKEQTVPKGSASISPAPVVSSVKPKPTTQQPTAEIPKLPKLGVSDSEKPSAAIDSEPTAPKSEPKPVSAMDAPIQSFLKRFRKPDAVSLPHQDGVAPASEADTLSRAENGGGFAPRVRPTPLPSKPILPPVLESKD
jgi:hypothetical protein